MVQVAPVSDISGISGSPTTEKSATDAFGLSFDNLLKIILTQLTYQDPLKPMDNFEFVSQLAQFSQIQIGQTGNDRLAALATAQANLQAASLLGKTVDIPAGQTVLTGKVVWGRAVCSERMAHLAEPTRSSQQDCAAQPQVQSRKALESLPACSPNSIGWASPPLALARPPVNGWEA